MLNKLLSIGTITGLALGAMSFMTYDARAWERGGAYYGGHGGGSSYGSVRGSIRIRGHVSFGVRVRTVRRVATPVYYTQPTYYYPSSSYYCPPAAW